MLPWAHFFLLYGSLRQTLLGYKWLSVTQRYEVPVVASQRSVFSGVVERKKVVACGTAVNAHYLQDVCR